MCWLSVGQKKYRVATGSPLTLSRASRDSIRTHAHKPTQARGQVGTTTYKAICAACRSGTRVRDVSHPHETSFTPVRFARRCIRRGRRVQRPFRSPPPPLPRAQLLLLCACMRVCVCLDPRGARACAFKRTICTLHDKFKSIPNLSVYVCAHARACNVCS